jgi:hypothetical protein
MSRPEKTAGYAAAREGRADEWELQQRVESKSPVARRLLVLLLRDEFDHAVSQRGVAVALAAELFHDEGVLVESIDRGLEPVDVDVHGLDFRPEGRLLLRQTEDPYRAGVTDHENVEEGGEKEKEQELLQAVADLGLMLIKRPQKRIRP